MGQQEETLKKLSEIVSSTNKYPIIINDTSNFVVVTYWWGRNNINQNTARPCVSFYEDVIKKVIKYFIDMINTVTYKVKDKNLIPVIIKNIFKSYREGHKTNDYNQIIKRTAFQYISSLYAYCNIIDNKLSEKDKNEMTRGILEQNKLSNKTPHTFTFKNRNEVENILFSIVKYAILLNETEIIQLYLINDQISELINASIENLQDPGILKTKIKELYDKKKSINDKIKTNLKEKRNHDVTSGFDNENYNNTNIFDILNIEFRYSNPLTFENMIEKWENSCKMMGCNFLSVEYPEFAQPGGYQMAINAKPLFISKSLELCGNRNILYIDGDMYIRKYPIIFDMRDVDFMARGWWIDPRSSWKMQESIMYDPYTFETSGGTMFFSQSRESKMLIKKWIEQSGKQYNVGKADDRILSLIFNTNKFLCNMKIIQLPIEYLWLSLDYDDRLLDEVYDYDISRMNEIICIEHPECLTSEDTAAGAGASSDRTPKFYSFIEYENLTPASEMMHEFIFFPNIEMSQSFASYFEYMDSITYLNDGNEALIKKKLVDPLNPLNNEQPIYVVKYDDKFSNRNEIVSKNLELTENMDITSLNLIKIDENTFEIQNVDNKINEKDMIPLIIKLLNLGNYVIYNPVNKSEYDKSYYDTVKSKLSLYKSLDFVFAPKIDSYDFSDFFKPIIKTNLPILFGPGNDVLTKFLSMFSSLEDLSDYINYGSYEFMSRIRVGYIFLSKNKVNVINNNDNSQTNMILTGGGMETYIEVYENGLESMYGKEITGGNKATRKHKKTYGKRKPKNKKGTRKNKM
jgi:hypothetical protein